jgi:hypothetical protein
MATTPTPPAGPPQAAPPPTPLPKKKSSSVIWWVLGAFLLALVLLIAAGVGTAYYFVRNTHIDQKNQQVSITTPRGTVTLQASNDVTNVGLPIYPGAQIAETGGGIEITAPGDKRVGVHGVKYRTGDSLEKVDAWYRQQLGPDFERRLPGDRSPSIHIQGVDVDSSDIAFVAQGEGLVRVVGLKKTGDGTQIDMARIGKQAAQ